MCTCAVSAHVARLSETAGLTLPLHEAEDVALADGSLDVTDDGPGRVVEELDADLRHVTGVAGAAEYTVDLGELDGGTFLGMYDTR